MHQSGGVGIFLVAVEYIESRACYSVVDAEAESQSFHERRFPAPKSPSRVRIEFSGNSEASDFAALIVSSLD